MSKWIDFRSDTSTSSFLKDEIRGVQFTRRVDGAFNVVIWFKGLPNGLETLGVHYTQCRELAERLDFRETLHESLKELTK